MRVRARLLVCMCYLACIYVDVVATLPIVCIFVFTLAACLLFLSQGECLPSDHSKRLQHQLLKLRTPTVAKYSKREPGSCVRARARPRARSRMCAYALS